MFATALICGCVRTTRERQVLRVQITAFLGKYVFAIVR
jgi:hypothetical protein